MKAQSLAFGEIEIDGQRYTHDVVIDGGQIHKRAKKASKPYREAYGHTLLSLGENLSWGGRQPIVGTGMYGRLLVLPEVHREAERRKVEWVVCRRKRRVDCWVAARIGTSMPCCTSPVESSGRPAGHALSF